MRSKRRNRRGPALNAALKIWLTCWSPSQDMAWWSRDVPFDTVVAGVFAMAFALVIGCIIGYPVGYFLSVGRIGGGVGAAGGGSVALWRGGLRAREVAKALGVPEFALPILATTGKIERITDRDALKLARTDILYDPGSVSRLADQLRGAATFTGPTQPLGAVFATEMLCGEAWSLVIDAILDGSLPARMASADENLIHKMGIDPAATEALRVQLRGLPVDDGVTVSYAVAARLMGTGEGDISDLVRNGLIRADQPTGRAMAIKCAELKAFRDRFVFPRELAHRMQILPQQARKAGNRIGLQPHKLKKARLSWLRSEFEARFDSSAHLAHEFQN